MTKYNQNLNVVLAFNTGNKYNQLSQNEKIELVTDITEKFGGVTLTEHIGGFRMDNGTNAVEYSYTFELFDVTDTPVREYFYNLASDNQQESLIINNEFFYIGH